MQILYSHLYVLFEKQIFVTFIKSFVFNNIWWFYNLLGSALGLLLVFRTNTAYNRFWEGRKIWEKILNSLRDLGRMTVAYGDVIQEERVERVLHLLCAFPLGMYLFMNFILIQFYSFFSHHLLYLHLLFCQIIINLLMVILSIFLVFIYSFISISLW